MRYWPALSVTAPSLVPSTSTDAPATGALDVESMTCPRMVALTIPAAALRGARGRALAAWAGGARSMSAMPSPVQTASGTLRGRC
jgi:hypothetical protein